MYVHLSSPCFWILPIRYGRRVCSGGSTLIQCGRIHPHDGVLWLRRSGESSGRIHRPPPIFSQRERWVGSRPATIRNRWRFGTGFPSSPPRRRRGGRPGAIPGSRMRSWHGSKSRKMGRSVSGGRRGVPGIIRCGGSRRNCLRVSIRLPQSSQKGPLRRR